MWKCDECGVIFEALAVWQEDRGEFWGQRAYETMSGCPCCHSTDVEEYDPEEPEPEEEGENDDDD